ncbi:MAG TPA: hypothetical protein VFU45_06135 [Gemmatimonadales bacterium]|nr:hypothetical protein [Gemmatimonadales bacterium]
MATFFERVNEAVGTAGRKAQAAMEQARLRIEQQRVRGERDHLLRELGQLFHREARGAAPDPARRDELFVAVDKADANLARIEKELAASKGEVVSVTDQPAAAPPEPPTKPDGA